MSQIIEKDLQHIWHPCSQMKDYQDFLPIPISKAQGSYLFTSDDQKIIDANASWWCKSLGHNHPRLRYALMEQLEKFEHIIGANTCSEVLVELSERLSELTTHLNKVFYASDGACAVEIALKMAFHAQQLAGNHNKTRFIALENSYHGDTLGALSVSDCGIFSKPYQSLLMPTEFIRNIPYVQSTRCPHWQDCSEHWALIEKQLEPLCQNTAAIIVEPIVQAAGGMKIYSADLLKRLRRWCDQHGVYLIADEIATGFGRTGHTFACQHAAIEPDFMCVSKGLTSGMLPMSAVMCSQTVYDLFYNDYQPETSFLHSHTHSGNALAAAVAVATLDTFANEQIYQRVEQNQSILAEMFYSVAQDTDCLENIRHIGYIVAADLKNPQQIPRLGYQVFQEAIKLGAWLRPIGNTVYWLPPLNIELETLNELETITKAAILNTMSKLSADQHEENRSHHSP